MVGITNRGWLGLAALGALAVAMPASAQMRSEGSKFLQAVDKKEGQTATAMLAAPGSTVINARDITTNRTALHIVVERRDQAWVDFLLARGADPNLADNKGVTPLLLAVRIGFMPGVEALVGAKARVDEANDAGETPLISAVHSRNLDLVRVLMKASADPDHADNSGRTARDYARLEDAPTTLVAELNRRNKPKSKGGVGDTYGPSL
ncbi:MAG: ankyrin repeat domain-containing protein [Croceibacterium sp.]